MIDFVAQAGLVAATSGVPANLQGEINVVGGVAVYLDLVDVPHHLRLLQTNILHLVLYGISIPQYLIESIELIGEVVNIIGDIQSVVE